MKIKLQRIDQSLRLGTLLVAWLLTACAPSGIGEKPGSPRDQLPDYITELTEVGAVERPAWSADGSRFLYLDDLTGTSIS